MHHAYLYDTATLLPDFSGVLAADKVDIQTAVLDIGTVRTLIAEANQQPFAPDGQRVIVVQVHTIRTEAQNALLKLLEEPPAHTEFHFVVAQHESLLPTLHSRFAKQLSTAVVHDATEAKAFSALSAADRVALVAEKTTTKDVAWYAAVLDGLEYLIHTKQLSPELFTTVSFVRTQINAPGASPKMLLEHLALSLSELSNS